MAEPLSQQRARSLSRERTDRMRGAMRDERGVLSRYVSSAADIFRYGPRALAEMVSAPFTDVYAAVRPREETGRRPTATADLLKLFGESARSTAMDIAAGQSIVNMPFGGGSWTPQAEASKNQWQSLYRAVGWDRGADILEERALQRHNSPLLTHIEDIGNISLTGAIGGRVAGGAAARMGAASRGIEVAPFSQRVRPLLGRQGRVDLRRSVGEIAQTPGPGQGIARGAHIGREIFGHPYQTSARAAMGIRTPAGTLGQSIKEGFSGPLEAFHERFPQFRPDAVKARRFYEDMVKEESRDARLGAYDNFDPGHAIPDAQQAIRAMDRFEPETLQALEATLPERTPLDVIRGRDPLTPEQTLDILTGVQELHRQGRTDVMPQYATPEGQLRLALTTLSLDERLAGLPTDSLVDLVPQMVRLDSAFPQLRNQQKLLREQGFTTDMIRDLYGGNERFILDERLLDPRIDQILAGRAADVPVPEGHTRVYRGSSGEFRPESAVDAGPTADFRGRYFTPDEQVARGFAEQSGGQLNYVDVPNETLASLRAGDTPESAYMALKEATEGSAEVILPRELAARARPESAPTAAAEHLQRAREAWIRFNDVDERSLVANQRIPEEGTRFRKMTDEDGNILLDADTGEALVRRIAEPDQPVPFERQGLSARQAGTQRRRQRHLETRARQVEKGQQRLADQQMEARAEVANLERTLARDISQTAKRAAAEGDSPQARELWRQFDELTEQYESLRGGQGLKVPERLRGAMDEVASSLDEVIALAGSPAAREMLTPQSYTRLQDALQNLRGAEEFLSANQERMAFFDALDQLDRRQLTQEGRLADATRQLGREQAAARGEGPQTQRAEGDVLRARQQAAEAQAGRETLFDVDASLARLEQAVGRYQQARQPYRETLIARQARARDALARQGRAERSLETAERKFAEAQAQMEASIEAAPAPTRDLLWLRQISDNLSSDMDRLVTEGLITPEIRNQLDIQGLPQVLEDITGSANQRLWREIDAGEGPFGDPAFDVSYIPDFAARADPSSATARPGGAIVRQAGTVQRRIGSTAPLEQSFRQIIVRRITDLRVEQFKQRFSDEVGAQFGYKPETVLREIAPDQNALRTWLDDPPKVEREMERAGYIAFRPGELFTFRQRRTGVGTPDEPLWIKQELANVIRDLNQSSGFENVLREIWNPATTGWKRVVLALRPAWHVYNAVGNATMAMFAGRISVTDAMDFMPIAAEAWQRNKFGYKLSQADLNSLPGGIFGRRAGRRLQRQGITELPDLPADARRSVFSQGITRRELQLDHRRTGLAEITDKMPGYQQLLQTQGGQQFQRVSKQVNRITGASYRANAFVDDLWRATVYLSRTVRHGDSPQAATTRTLEALGNYQKMTAFEKNYIRSVYPFYAWVRHITSVAARGLRPENIGRTALLGHVTQILGQPNEFEEMLPGYASGDIHLGETPDGIPIFLGTYGLNPFTDVTQPLMVGGHFNPAGVFRGAHPVVQMGVEQGFGINTMTGRPFSTPTPRRDEQGNIMPTSPPLREQLIQTIPQATVARDVFRAATGAPRTRYGTGEPLLIPGVRDTPTMSRVGQLFGANIRPIDVEAMHAQRIRARYEEERQKLRFDERLEQERNDRQGPMRLPEMPLPGS